jgi:hypothetical protein
MLLARYRFREQGGRNAHPGSFCAQSKKLPPKDFTCRVNTPFLLLNRTLLSGRKEGFNTERAEPNSWRSRRRKTLGNLTG